MNLPSLLCNGPVIPSAHNMDDFSCIPTDKAGVKYLARLGLTALVTTKPYLVKIARDEGLIKELWNLFT
ncbi:MAG: hypothetical protein DDT36_00583 [Firmicutes bacterium]|nr:hypothetical protein [Bacillota bacterium]